MEAISHSSPTFLLASAEMAIKIVVNTEPDLVNGDHGYRLCSKCFKRPDSMVGHMRCGLDALFLPKLVVWGIHRDLHELEEEGVEGALAEWHQARLIASSAYQEALELASLVLPSAGGAIIGGDHPSPPDPRTLRNLYETLLESSGFVQDTEDPESWRYLKCRSSPDRLPPLGT